MANNKNLPIVMISVSPTPPTMDERLVEWSHLPEDLLSKIAEAIRIRIDHIRFRSVCKSWRSSVPPLHPNSPSFPIKVPPLHRRLYGDDFILTQTTFYHITPPSNNNNDYSPKGWLVQVEDYNSNHLPFRLFHPFSSRRITDPPKFWDLLRCGVIELCKSYIIKSDNGGDPLTAVTKVVFFPNPGSNNVEDFVVFGIFKEGRLIFMRYGDQSWGLVDDRYFHYDDVIVYKGRIYVVNRWGIVYWIDLSSMTLRQYSPPVDGSGGKKDLVESRGRLYVVERYYEGGARRGTSHIDPVHDAEVVDFKVYKLDEDLGLVDVKSLDDRVIVLGDGCSFSVSAKEFAGYHENCIYFFDFNHVRMYNLNDGSIVKVGSYPSFPNLFWPPPSWL